VVIVLTVSVRSAMVCALNARGLESGAHTDAQYRVFAGLTSDHLPGRIFAFFVGLSLLLALCLLSAHKALVSVAEQRESGNFVPLLKILRDWCGVMSLVLHLRSVLMLLSFLLAGR
jgi:hypothetical protein